jgi:hypothetical protein
MAHRSLHNTPLSTRRTPPSSPAPLPHSTPTSPALPRSPLTHPRSTPFLFSLLQSSRAIPSAKKHVLGLESVTHDEHVPHSPPLVWSKWRVSDESEVTGVNEDVAPVSVSQLILVMTRDTDEAANLIRALFSSPVALCDSFLKKQVTSTDNLVDEETLIRREFEALDIEALPRIYKKLVLNKQLEHELTQAFEIIVFRLAPWAKTVVHPRQLRVFLILLQNPLLTRSESYVHTLKRLIRAMRVLPESTLHMLVKMIARLPANRFLKIVQTVQHSFDTFFTPQLYRTSEELRNALLILQRLYKANEEHVLIEPQLFYDARVNSELTNLKDEYKLWKSGKPSLSLFDYPFLFTPIIKAKLFHIDSFLEMSSKVEDAITLAAFSEIMKEGSFPGMQQGHGLTSELVDDEIVAKAAATHLYLSIRREHVIEDTLEQIKQKLTDLKKPLKVKFMNEEGVDQGGVTKEFCQLIVHELFRPEMGLFVYDNDNRHIWFNDHARHKRPLFELTGLMIGLAMYNGVILDVQFPQAIYSKLLGEKVTLRELKQFNPALTRGLEQLLAYEGDVEDLAMTFEIQVQINGEAVTVDLLQVKRETKNRNNNTIYGDLLLRGDDVAVTNQNRQEFVDLYVDYLLNISIERMFSAFSAGFHLVCGADVLKLCRPFEIEQLICGSPVLDFDALESRARYVDYEPHSPVIRHLWQVVRGMSEENKKKFLAFVTGTDRAPLKGLGEVALTIQRNGPDSNRLPTGHTCFSMLLLPEYDSYDKVHTMVLTAIQNYQGFGLA